MRRCGETRRTVSLQWVVACENHGQAVFWPTFRFFSFPFLTGFCTTKVRQPLSLSAENPPVPRDSMMTTKTFKDRPLFLSDLVLHEVRNMFGLEYHYTPGSVSPLSNSTSPEGMHESSSRYVDDAVLPCALPTTVNMRDLYYWCPIPSDDGNQETDLFMEELGGEMAYLRQVDGNLYVQCSLRWYCRARLHTLVSRNLGRRPTKRRPL